MAIELHNLKSTPKKTVKRRGRGNASGRGTYSGRGQKGQRSRSGGKSGLKRLGVKQYLKQIPKTRGFKSPHPGYQVVNISDLEKIFKDGDKISFGPLIKAGLIPDSKKRVKILGTGEIKKKLEVKAAAFSKTALTAIEKAGGKAIIINKKKEAEKDTNKKKTKK